jgi:stage II sporulation protein AA (anti-sigma F factor antagonist)
LTLQERSSAVEQPVVVSFRGELDAADDSLAADLLARVEAGADRLIVDLLNVSFIDSSVIRALVLAYRATEEAGGWLRVVYTHHVVRRVIEMCGLSEVLPQFATVESARRGVASAPPDSEQPEGSRP